MKLNEGDVVVTAFAERCSGPGWSNHPIWVIVRDADHHLREECIQPEEFTQDMHTLQDISMEVSKAMTAAVNTFITSKRRQGK